MTAKKLPAVKKDGETSESQLPSSARAEVGCFVMCVWTPCCNVDAVICSEESQLSHALTMQLLHRFPNVYTHTQGGKPM